MNEPTREDKNKTATVGDVERIVEDLAITIANGFAHTVSKEDFTEFKAEMYEFRDDMLGFKDDTEGFKKEIGITLSRIDSKLEDHGNKLKEIDRKLEPVVIAYPLIKQEVRMLNDRMDKLEKE